jgi:hypothetical protein
MQFKYVSGPPASVSTEALVLCVESDGARDSQFKAADKALGGRLSKRIKQVEFQGGVGETLVVYSGSKSKLAAATRIVALVGAGPRKSVTPTLLRDLAANAVRAAESVRAKSLGFVIPPRPRSMRPRGSRWRPIGSTSTAPKTRASRRQSPRPSSPRTPRKNPPSATPSTAPSPSPTRSCSRATSSTSPPRR